MKMRLEGWKWIAKHTEGGGGRGKHKVEGPQQAGSCLHDSFHNFEGFDRWISISGTQSLMFIASNQARFHVLPELSPIMMKNMLSHPHIVYRIEKAIRSDIFNETISDIEFSIKRFNSIRAQKKKLSTCRKALLSVHWKLTTLTLDRKKEEIWSFSRAGWKWLG